MNILEIQTASLSDLHTLSDLERRVFDYDVVTQRQMKYLLTSKTAIITKAVLNSLLVGYMILLTRKNSSVLRIYSLAISKEERQRGIGRQLLQKAEQCAVKTGCERIHLELRQENTPALVFYLSEGYSLYGRREHYYTDGAPAMLLRKYITPGGKS